MAPRAPSNAVPMVVSMATEHDRILFIFGLGYTGTAVAHQALRAGFTVCGSTRSGDRPEGLDSRVRVVPFPPLRKSPHLWVEATHVLSTAPPSAEGDPVLGGLRKCGGLGPVRWAGYCSTTSVYGDHKGEWVDESTRADLSSTSTSGVRSGMSSQMDAMIAPGHLRPCAQQGSANTWVLGVY